MITRIYRHAIDLHALNEEIKEISAPTARAESVKKPREIKEWFGSTLSSVETTFERFLKLVH